MGVIRKLTEKERVKTQDAVVKDTHFAKLYPALWEFMTAAEYDDGSPRQKSSLTTFTQDGLFKALLKDPDNERCLWGSGETFSAALQCLNDLAADPDAVWREDRYANASGHAKRKK